MRCKDTNYLWIDKNLREFWLARWQGTGTCHTYTYWFTLRYLSASSSRRENFCIRPAGSSPLVINFIFRRIQFHISLSSAAYLDGRLWFSSINATTSSYLACQRSDWVIEDCMVAVFLFNTNYHKLSINFCCAYIYDKFADIRVLYININYHELSINFCCG